MPKTLTTIVGGVLLAGSLLFPRYETFAQDYKNSQEINESVNLNEAQGLEYYLLTQDEMNKYGLKLAENTENPNPYFTPNYIVERMGKEVGIEFFGVEKMVVALYQATKEKNFNKGYFEIIFSATQFNKKEQALKFLNQCFMKEDYSPASLDGNNVVVLGIHPSSKNKYLKQFITEYFQKRNIKRIMGPEGKIIQLNQLMF